MIRTPEEIKIEQSQNGWNTKDLINNDEIFPNSYNFNVKVLRSLKTDEYLARTLLMTSNLLGIIQIIRDTRSGGAQWLILLNKTN
jgi:hypothetical protein